MFTEQSVTISPNAAKTLPKVVSQGMSSTYRTADSALVEQISHQVDKNTGNVRSLVRLDVTKADPDPASTKDLTLGIQVVFSRPPVGFTEDEMDAAWAGLKAQMVTAFVKRIYGLES